MTMAKRALITVVTGQDGSYLTEFLLAKGYEVHGVVRRASTENFDRISHLGGRVALLLLLGVLGHQAALAARMAWRSRSPLRATSVRRIAFAAATAWRA